MVDKILWRPNHTLGDYPVALLQLLGTADVAIHGHVVVMQRQRSAGCLPIVRDGSDFDSLYAGWALIVGEHITTAAGQVDVCRAESLAVGARSSPSSRINVGIDAAEEGHEADWEERCMQAAWSYTFSWSGLEVVSVSSSTAAGWPVDPPTGSPAAVHVCCCCCCCCCWFAFVY